MSEWISVKDRLPSEKYNWYIVFENSGYPEVTMAFYDGKVGDNGCLWLCHNDAEDRDEWTGVTHWMPLPEPPL